MGTTCSGRYLNTKGSGKRVSDFALVHSNEGDFKRSIVKSKGKKIIKLRLANGGHGQKSIELLEKYSIDYKIIKTFSNGVRVGYVDNHADRRKRSGNHQTWFPKNWTEKDIKRAGEHVASLKGNRHLPDGKTAFGTYKGIRVGIIRTHGKIATVFPDKNQGITLRKKRKK